MATTEPRGKFSLQAELAKLTPEERLPVEGRLAVLREQLQKMPEYGPDIHDGSRLAWSFATDAEGALDVEDIAHEMVSVHFLHCQTDYPQWVQERLRVAADILHEAYPTLYWDKLWKLVVRFGVPIVKYASALQLMDGHQGEEPLPPEEDAVMADQEGQGATA